MFIFWRKQKINLIVLIMNQTCNMNVMSLIKYNFNSQHCQDSIDKRNVSLIMFNIGKWSLQKQNISLIEETVYFPIKV